MFDEIEAALLTAIHELLPLAQLIRIEHITLPAAMLSLKIFQTFQSRFLSRRFMPLFVLRMLLMNLRRKAGSFPSESSG